MLKKHPNTITFPENGVLLFHNLVSMRKSTILDKIFGTK